MRSFVNFLIVALVALALTVLPGGQTSLGVLLTLLTLLFFAGIALFGIKLYRENQLTLDAMGGGERFALYGSIALALFAFTATGTLFAYGGIGIAVWFVLLGLAAFGLYWSYVQARSYG